ncbi:hypothetical protein KBC85_03220 [Candidatus Saccharibacteria bacterium]|nr:hypothetical protein [Candidatus Saccharibacteria bacterium]
MNPLKKQDLQIAVQQLRSAILGQLAVRFNTSTVSATVQRQTLTVADMQQALEASRERFIERLGQPFKQQQITNQAMMSQLDALNRRLLGIEAQLISLGQMVKSVQLDADVIAQQSEPQKTTLFSKMFS